MKCRFCLKSDLLLFLDLGEMAPSNNYLSLEDLERPEKTYPLRLFVCRNCWLVQIEDHVKSSDLFRADYAYFSSTSSSWLSHTKEFSNKIISKLRLGKNSLVIEVGCNDGYLLKNFINKRIPCFGIEPTKSTADEAKRKKIPVLCKFFNASLADNLAKKNLQADLIIGNNVFAHVPDILNFARGLKILLKPNGVVTLEFPHLLHFLRGLQFDTVYHEHFCYLSLDVVIKILKTCDLNVWEVEELQTHGGSLRVYASLDSSLFPVSLNISKILKKEKNAGLFKLRNYLTFQYKVNQIRKKLLDHLKQSKLKGRKVIGYGAAAKGNTLLNFAGVKADLLEFVCDAAPSKQGKFLPGSHIPILSPGALLKYTPDEILILPWNIADEIEQGLRKITRQGVRFFTAVPHLKFR